MSNLHAKIYVAGENGAKRRTIRDIVQLKAPLPGGYTWHGMSHYDGCLVVVGAMAPDASYWYDLDIPLRNARAMMGLEARHA